MRSRQSAVALTVVALMLAVPRPAAAQAVTVVVDGLGVSFDQPPEIIGGRVLIPLRGVFERLGAAVEWRPESRTVVARRGSTTVVLQPGNPSARVDDRVVALDVPAMIIGGRTLVPLRFVGEALGAAVDWDPARRIVSVRSPAAVAPPLRPLPTPRPIEPTPVPPPIVIDPRPPVIVVPPPITPAPPAFVLIEGTVVRVDAFVSPQRVLVRSATTIHTIIVTPATAVFVVDARTGQGGAAGLTQVRRGDAVSVEVDGRGQAVTLRATYREIAGRLDRLSGHTLALADGQTFVLAGDPLFLIEDQEVTRDLLERGMDVVLRVNPVTGQVWEVRARGRVARPVPPPIPPPVIIVPPRIDRIWMDATGPLGVGAILTVMLDGTPGGAASFDIAGVASGVPMTEGPPGRYTGRRTIRAGETAREADLLLRLRVGGQEIRRTAAAVTIDGVPPEFTRRTPEPNSRTTDTGPEIAIEFADRGPAGMDLDSLRVWIEGASARRTAVSPRRATFVPRAALSPGRIRVQATIADLAGNEATTAWTFTVEPGPRPTPTQTARLDAPMITAPRQGDRIIWPLVVEGTAARARQVELVVVVETPGVTADLRLPPVVVEVDPRGRWTARIALQGVPQVWTRIVITAVAVGPGDLRSEPTRLELTPPP